MTNEELHTFFQTKPSAHVYYREVVVPEMEAGELNHPDVHLQFITQLPLIGGIYYETPDASNIYVDNWHVSAEVLTHRHPEFGGGAKSCNFLTRAVEVDVISGQCDLCRKKIPGEIQMMHWFHQF
jgi:hypothetical protein